MDYDNISDTSICVQTEDELKNEHTTAIDYVQEQRVYHANG